MKRLLVNLGPLVHLSGNGPIAGDLTDETSHVLPAGMAILVNEHVIERIGHEGDLIEEYQGTETIDLEGKAVIPGLVDAHTHLLWAGDRSREISWKHQGMSYRQIADKGGGIAYTVEQTRNLPGSELAKIGIKRMEEALRNGTTHLEAKSGYGLSTESELKLLEIAESISAVDNLPSLDLTWMGAHAAPPGEKIESYYESVISDQLPNVIEQGIARSVDVFCEPGWFSIEQSEELLKESKKNGLDLRIHIDEFEDGGGGDLAAELKVQTADHAHHTKLDTRINMANANVMTGFLPGTPYSMGEPYPDFHECIANNVQWSIATDFNPNCRTLSLPFVASILVQRNEITPITALAACTRNSAQTTPHPSGLVHGQICEGGIANLNIVDGPYWEAWCVQPGHSPFSATMLEGKMIYH